MSDMEVDSDTLQPSNKESSEGIDKKEVEDSYEYLSESFPSLLHAIKLCAEETDLKCIDVENLNLETSHMKAIFNLLPDTEVTELRADRNNIQWGMPEFTKQLSKSNIQKLSFKNCNLRVLDVLALMQALQNLQVTDLDLSCLSFTESYHPTSAKMFFVHLVRSHLTHLRLTASPLLGHSSGKDLAFHLPNTSITHLWLERTEINRGKEALTDLFSILPKTSVTELHLGCNEIDDDQLKLLCESLKQSKLEVLDLHSNKITDAGMNLLSEAMVGSKLLQLIVRKNNITGANNLGKHLKETSITVLDLGGNKIENCEMFSLPDFLKDTLVTELYLEHCELGEEVAQKLLKCLKSSKVTKINMSGNHLGLLSASKLVNIAEDTKISEVDFSENNFSVEALQVLGEGIKELKPQKFILRGGSNKQEGSSVAAFVEKTKGTALKSLDISLTDFRNESNILAASLKNVTLTHLNLASCEIGPGVVDLAPVLKDTGITYLNLSDNNIDNTGAEKLAEFLKETKIVHLKVKDNLISDKGAESLAFCLKSGPLYRLNLENNKITDDGIVEIADMLEGTFVTDVEVSNNTGHRIIPLVAVMWRNRLRVHKLISFFKTVFFANIQAFRFNPPKDRTELTKFTEKCLLFYKDIVDEPSAVCALIANKCFSDSNRTKVTEIMDEFPKQYALAIERKAKVKMTSLLKMMERAKALGLNKIVDCFAAQLAAQMLEQEEDCLLPEGFDMFEKHKETIANMASKPEDKAKILRQFVKRPACGLCGKSRNLVKTDCCNNWICNDSHKYVPFTYSRVSCYRNHDRYTLCSYHHNEGHAGRWQDCQECKDDFDGENYADYTTNNYNFEKLQGVKKPVITCSNCGYKSVDMKNFSMNSSHKGWFCSKKACFKKGMGK